MEAIEVRFYDHVCEKDIRFVVIVARYQQQWVWVKHKERDTYELCGGHREANESVEEGARRELQEESGALRYDLVEIAPYSVIGKTRVNSSGEESFGMLYYANIMEIGKLEHEIEAIALFDEVPAKLTYPSIQPTLFEYVKQKV